MQTGASALQPCFKERELLQKADFFGVECCPVYMYKSKLGAKKDKSKEAYKMPHKLIEKKRRDRINECISHLKDQLPEHLKLTTLGHLEKAVILELTLKHLKALTTLTEQQHQRIIALQNGEAPLKAGARSDLDLSRHGLQTCAQERVHQPGRLESWSGEEQMDGQLMGQREGRQPARGREGQAAAGEERTGRQESGRGGGGRNRVPVIRHTQAAEPSGSDTDTDSGYGGDGERSEGNDGGGLEADPFKLEPDEPPAKRVKAPEPNPALSTLSPLTHTPPFCLPLYFVTPPATSPYSPTLDKSGLERYWYPGHLPLFYPRIPALAPDPRLTQIPSVDMDAMVGLCSPGAPAMPAVGMQRDTSPITRLLQSIGGTSTPYHTLPHNPPSLLPLSRVQWID
ncbi:class E basic helix-loop-helix protein 41 [Amblyraja radiata]|uniref:class E basic helix-loop-helix protein 41 n=1 Tax=Amblyraja radiata TaxID=386614 RepID=UPI001402F0A7|nr:class E basic helix-loop-helix protein 41 [Amblyraja radiata]